MSLAVDAPYLASNCGHASKAVYVTQTSFYLSASDSQPPACQIIITDTRPRILSTAAVLPRAQACLFAHTNNQTRAISTSTCRVKPLITLQFRLWRHH